jgi:hypothetical protein
MPILVATDRDVVVIDVERGTSAPAHGIADRPTCLATDPLVHRRGWCGTHRGGVFRSDDGGTSWQSVGLAGRLIMAVTASPVEQDVVWAGTDDRTHITFAGSRAIRSSRNDSGLRLRPAPSCPRSTVAAHGATAFLVDRGTLTTSPFTTKLPIPCASRLAMRTRTTVLSSSSRGSASAAP